MEIYKTVVGNNAPDLSLTLKRNGTVIDLTSASSVVLIITNERTGGVTNAGSACAISSPATSGIVTYTPVVNDYPGEGRYIGEAKITYSGGKVEHIEEVLLILARDKTN